MKRLLITSTILIMLTTSFGTAIAKNTKLCHQLAIFAASVMKLRQAGTPIYKTIEIVTDVIKDPKQLTIVEQIIKMAYNSPRYATPKYQKRAIDDFRNKVYLTCWK